MRGRIATGRRTGQRVRRLGDRIDAEDVATLEGPRCASVAGVSLHANCLADWHRDAPLATSVVHEATGYQPPCGQEAASRRTSRVFDPKQLGGSVVQHPRPDLGRMNRGRSVSSTEFVSVVGRHAMFPAMGRRLRRRSRTRPFFDNSELRSRALGCHASRDVPTLPIACGLGRIIQRGCFPRSSRWPSSCGEHRREPFLSARCHLATRRARMFSTGSIRRTYCFRTRPRGAPVPSDRGSEPRRRCGPRFGLRAGIDQTD